MTESERIIAETRAMLAGYEPVMPKLNAKIAEFKAKMEEMNDVLVY